MSESPTIAELLAHSRAAHAEYRAADTKGDKTARHAALQRAYEARAAAEAADPDHHDADAWAEDASAWRSLPRIHAKLLEFYMSALFPLT